jgi:adenylate cyclase
MQHTGLHVCIVAACVAGVTLAFRSTGSLVPLELAAFDYLVQAVWQGPARDPRVALVLVTEGDIQATGQWPVSDERLARALAVIDEAGARAIGVDIYRDVPVPPGHEALDAQLRSTPSAVFITRFASPGETEVAPPPALAGTDQVGFNNVVLDEDGVVRRMALFMDAADGSVGYAFPLLVSLLYLGVEGIQPVPDPDRPELLRLGSSTYEPLTPYFGGYHPIDSGGYQAPLDLRQAAQGYDSITLTQLLTQPESRDILRDRAVMVGVAAESVRDPFRIALQPGQASHIPGIELHAHMAASMIRRAFGEDTPLRSTRDENEVAWILLMAGIGAAAGAWIRSGRVLMFATAGGIIALWLLGRYAIGVGVWLPVVAPGLSWIGSIGSVGAYLARRERHERGQLMNLFSRHVSPEIAKEVWEHREEFLEDGQRPRRQRLVATSFFADLVDFTSRTEKLDPAVLMDWLEEFLEVLARAVIRRGGLVEDYFGDGLMACFGVPLASDDPEVVAEHARSAVQAALDICTAIDGANADWQMRGLPTAAVRIGIATGVIIAGSLGSTTRAKFCVVGESVVTAQRIQSIMADHHDFSAEPYRILIDEETRGRLDAGFDLEPAGSFGVKGKANPVTVHRVIPTRMPAGSH